MSKHLVAVGRARLIPPFTGLSDKRIYALLRTRPDWYKDGSWGSLSTVGGCTTEDLRIS